MAKRIFTLTELQTADVDFVLEVQSTRHDLDREFIFKLAQAVRPA